MTRYTIEKSGLTESDTTGPLREIRHYLTSACLGLAAAVIGSIGTAQACSAWNGQTGTASYYGPGLQGNRTANGEVFNMYALTAAHPCMPLGTSVRVTVLGTGRSVVVWVNDRLPSRHRILDLSVGAARALGITNQGIATVQLTPG